MEGGAVVTLTESERRCLQAHARRALEGVDRNRGARERESVWHTDRSRTWTPTTLNDLEERGLIFVREEWKDCFVHITEAGFDELAGREPW
jgi:hypothetical protein